MTEFEFFHDRRPKPAASVRLTRRQRELAEQYGIGTPDDRGNLVLKPSEQKKVIEASAAMLHRSQEWDRRERSGDLRSAQNLHEKLFATVSSSAADRCPGCQGNGCRTCVYTGKNLR